MKATGLVAARSAGDAVDDMHLTSELTLLAAIGIDGEDAKNTPLGLLKAPPKMLPWCR